MKRKRFRSQKKIYRLKQNEKNDSLLYTVTKHFKERLRERGIPRKSIAGIISETKESYGGDARLIVPEKMMKKYRLRHLGTNIIIVLNSYRLITAFAISNLYEYLVFNNNHQKHYLL